MTKSDNGGSMPDFRVGSYNVSGLGDPVKRKNIFTWLKGKPESIFCLQETHAVTFVEDKWKKEWDGQDIFFSNGSTKSTGVAILVKKNSDIIINRHQELVQGRAHLLEISVGAVNLCIINVYSPNNDDISFLQTVFHDTLGRQTNDYVLFGGDWNAVMDDKIDKSGGAKKHSSQKSQKFLNEIVTDYGLNDVYRLLRGNERLYTHFNRTSKTNSRLDFFLIDDALVNFPVCNPEISHGYLSDHSYITLHLRGTPIERGRGYWKLNNSHLEDETFVNEIREIFKDTMAEAFDSYQGLWDVIKFKIKSHAIRHGKRTKKKINTEKETLQAEISRIQKIPKFMEDQKLYNILIESESKLNTIIDREVQGVITRSRANWVEKGERSTRYFFGLEKCRGKNKDLTKIYKDDKYIYEQNEISSHVVDYFQKVYTSKRPNKESINKYISDLEDTLPKMDNEFSLTLEEQISELEFDIVVK